MEYINKKFKELVNELIYMNTKYETRTITWNETIKSFEKSLEIITDIKSQDNLTDDEYIILRKLIEKLIERGIDGPVTNIRSYKRNRLADLTTKAKKELEDIPTIEEKYKKIETLNDWIKSLRIFKLHDQFLSTQYYESSYELYSDIKKIILTKNPPMYKKIYLGRVVDKIENENNQRTLPQNLSLKIADYELSSLAKLIKDNPDFNFRLMNWSYEKDLINSRFERGEMVNNLRLLIKR